MKTAKNILQRKQLLIFLISIAILICAYSCARKVNFRTSTEVPAAQGKVKVTKSNNNNFKIKISLINLAEPSRLKPSKEVYVVWMKTENNLTKNLGQIESSTGFLSKKLKASFETVSPFSPVEVFITAENEPNIEYPKGVVVLSTDNF